MATGETRRARPPRRAELIASDRVEGTKVFRPNGDKIGHIERIMIEKRSGQAAYAVMNFGGFLGLGEYPIRCPGRCSTTIPRLGGYEVNVTDEQLKRRRAYVRRKLGRRQRHRDTMIYDFYGVPPYWL